MKIIISFVLLLAVATNTANVISSYGGNQITMKVNTHSSGDHNLTFTTTSASTISVASGNKLNALCASVPDANYTLAATTKGFSYQNVCSGGSCTAAASSATLTPKVYSVDITYTSDISIGITAVYFALSYSTASVFLTSSLVDEITFSSAISNIPLPGDPTSYYVCWSSLDNTVDFGTFASPLSVTNIYNATISSSSNSLSFVGLAAISAAIVSLI